MGLIRQDFGKTFRIKQNIWKIRVFCLPAVFIQVLRCREFFETHGKTRFYLVKVIFVRHFESFWELLFYSKRKVWTISCRMRTSGASCDKNSLLWFQAKFWWKKCFFEIRFFSKKIGFRKKTFFDQNFVWNRKYEFVSHEAPEVLIRQEIVHTLRLK